MHQVSFKNGEYSSRDHCLTKNELYNYFQDYDQVPKIAELRNSVKDTKDELTKRILNDFKYKLDV